MPTTGSSNRRAVECFGMLVLVPAVVPVKVPAAAAAAVAAAVVVDADVDVGMLVSTAVASQAAMSPHPATTGQRLVRPKSRLGCWAWGVRGVQWCGAGGWQGGRAEHSTQGEPRKQSGSAATHRMYTAWCSVAQRGGRTGERKHHPEHLLRVHALPEARQPDEGRPHCSGQGRDGCHAVP